MDQQMILEAFDLKSKGYYKQAIELLYKVLAEEENNTEVLSEISTLYFLLNNYERSSYYAEKVLETEENNIVCLTNLCKINYRTDKLEQAKELAEKIYSLEKNQENLMLLLEILNKMGKYEEVTKYENEAETENTVFEVASAKYHLNNNIKDILDKIFSIRPDFSKALFLAGNYYYDKKDYDSAKKVFLNLIEQDKTFSDAYNKLGLIYLDNMELDKAEECFLEALKLDNVSGIFNYNLGQTYFLKGWLEEAKKYFTKAIYIEPENDEYRYSLAYLYYRKGDLEKAESELNKNYLPADILLYKIKAQQGDFASAKNGLENLLKIYPNNELLCSSLANVYFNLDMFRQAKKLLVDLISKNPDMKDAHKLLCEILIKINDLDDAEKYIKSFAEMYPKYISSYVLMAKLNYAKKDYDEVYEITQKIIELDSNCADGYYYNALALFEQRDIDFAIESLKKAISLDVNNADLYVKMGEFYQATGQLENALAYITEASEIDDSEKNRELYKNMISLIRNKK